MEAILFLISLIGFVWVLLCIILISKIWGMTNDVKVIKNVLLTIPDKLNTTNNIISSNGETTTNIQPELGQDIEEGDLVVNIETGEELTVAQIFPDGDVACKPQGFGLRKLVRRTNLKKINE